MANAEAHPVLAPLAPALHGAPRACAEMSMQHKTIAPDRQGCEEAIGAYKGALVNVAYRITNDMETAKDVVQDTYLAALEAKMVFAGASSLKTYLYRIVINKCIDLRRRKFRWHEILEAFSREPVPFYNGTDDDLDNKELVHLLFKGIPDTFRIPLILAEVDGMSYEEIAATLGISTNTVRTRIFRCREKLRKAFQKTGRFL